VMSRAKASSVGPTQGSGEGRSLLRRTSVTRAARDGFKESGAPSHRRAPFAAIALLALACLQLAVFASSSRAAVAATSTYAPGAFFGSQGSDPGQFSEPRQIAVEKSTGNLLVTDSGNGRVQVFAADADGNPSYLTTLGAGTVLTPVGIAVDPGDGSIYVSDSGAGKIFRFASDGAATPTYTLDATFTSPTLSSYASTLAVDPSTHDLLVADAGSQEVRRIDGSDGSQISAFNGSTSSGGQFTSLRNVAVAASGTIYVVDEPYPAAIHFEGGAGRVERFDASGNPLGQLQGVDQEGAVAADPGSASVAVGWHNNFDARPTRIARFEGSDSPAASVDLPVDGATAALTFSGASPARLYVLMEVIGGFFGTPGIQPLRPAERPGSDLGPTGAVTATTAHVTGTIAPGTISGPGSARFEVSLDGTTWVPGSEQTGIAGPGETTVADDLTGLRPNSAYSLRLRAANDDFATLSALGSFTTDTVAPGVGLGPLTDRSANGAVLNGTVNPFGQETTYHFEYGLTAAYGQRLPLAHEDVAGHGYSPRNTLQTISGLEPSTTYHYRLVATNATGTSSTPDATFTTRSATEPARAYEQVSPVDKGGAVISTYGYHQTNDDGDAIVYQTKSAMDRPEVQSAPIQPRYAATRSPSGWAFHPLDPPQDPSYNGAQLASAFTMAASPDKSHVLVSSNQVLAPDAVAGSGNLYRRDLASGTYEFIASGFEYPQLVGLTGMRSFYGGNSDFSVIYLHTTFALVSGAPLGTNSIYRWSTTHGLELVSPNDGFITRPEPLIWPPHRNVTEDGSGYFSLAGGAQPGIYRSTATGTVRVAAAGVAEPTLLDVSADGRYLAYFSEGSVFRYDAEADQTEVIFTSTDADGGRGYMGMSEDGSTLLDSGASGVNLRVWREGSLTAVASGAGGEALRERGIMISPNGRFVVFSNADLVGQTYDNSGCRSTGADDSAAQGRCLEIYVYDADVQVLSCASCPADGSRSSGHAHLNTIQMELGLTSGRRVTNDGSVIFDTPARLVAADRNGTRDVYLYRDREAELISPGNGPYNASVADASADFHDVFFVTDQPLVGQDRDNQFDVYDSRVGGGIPAQSSIGGALATCSGADCRGPVSAGTLPASVAGSEAVSDLPRKLRPKRHRKLAHKKQKAKHGGGRRGGGGDQAARSPNTPTNSSGK
jgi:hypothetical protein